MSDKALVLIFIASALVCIFSVVKYVQQQTQPWFISASVSGLVCAACFLWVYYDF